MRAALLVFFAACAGSPAPASAPRGPSPVVRADVAQATDAELARKHDVARAQYEQAISDARDPKSESFARREYANTLASWGELPAAIAQLERAVVATPADPRPWQDLGVLRGVQHDVPGARDALQHAKALIPDKYPPRVALAALLWQSGDTATALVEYRELAALELPDRLREKVQWAIDYLSIQPQRHAAPLPAGGEPRPADEPQRHAAPLPAGGEPRPADEPQRHAAPLPAGGEPRPADEPQRHAAPLPAGGEPRPADEPQRHAAPLPAGGEPRPADEPQRHAAPLPAGGELRPADEPQRHAAPLPAGGEPRPADEPQRHAAPLPAGGEPRPAYPGMH